jgi:hypothetical protein
VSRMHAASKYGQAFSPQSIPSGLMSARSPLAPGIGELASTRGDKLGKATKQAAAIAATAMAEAVLIMAPHPWLATGAAVRAKALAGVVAVNWRGVYGGRGDFAVTKITNRAVSRK